MLRAEEITVPARFLTTVAHFITTLTIAYDVVRPWKASAGFFPPMVRCKRMIQREKALSFTRPTKKRSQQEETVRLSGSHRSTVCEGVQTLERRTAPLFTDASGQAQYAWLT